MTVSTAVPDRAWLSQLLKTAVDAAGRQVGVFYPNPANFIQFLRSISAVSCGLFTPEYREIYTIIRPKFNRKLMSFSLGLAIFETLWN
jgi:hypothetical protein